MTDNQVEYIIQFQDRASARFDPIIRKVQTLQQRVDATTSRMTQRFDATGRAIARVPGKIETLRDKLERLRIKSEQAFDEKHIIRYNRMIRQTEVELSRLNHIGVSGIGKGGRGVLGMLSGAGGMMGKFGPAMLAGGAVAIVAAAGAAVASLGKSAAQTAAKYEQLTTGFEVLLGSKGKADKMVGELVDYAARSPLRNEDIFPATQTLLSFGVSAERILPTIKMLGDVSMGNSERFSGLSLAFAQVQSTGRLMGQDLLQMVNQGFNPLQEISQMTGKSMRDLKEDMEKGRISADMVTNAFEHATAQGGRFYGMADKMGKTLGGRWSTIQDNIEKLQKSVGEKLYGTFSGALTVASRFVEKLTELVDIPIEDKIGAEVEKIHLLQSKLNNANISEQDRLDLLTKLEDINPEIVKGINAESINYNLLASNIDKVVGKLKEKIFWDRADKKYGKELAAYENYQGRVNDAETSMSKLFTKYGFTGSNFTANKQNTLSYLALKKEGGISYSGSGSNMRQIDTRNEEAKDYESLIDLIQFYNQNRIHAAVQQKTMDMIKKENESLAKQLGYSPQTNKAEEQSKPVKTVTDDPTGGTKKVDLIIRPGTERANVADEGQVREALKPAMEISRLESRGYAKLFNLREQVAEKVYQNKIGRIETIQLEKILSTMNSVAARSIPEHPNAINPSGSFDPEAGRAIMTGSGTRDIHIHMGKFMEQVVINNSNSAKEGATESVEKTKEAFLNLLKSINSLSVRQ